MSKKNLIFVFADQWRNSSIGFWKEEDVSTPNIDKFSKESVVFENACSTFPLCSPHRASLMTGKYPLSCGFYTNCKNGIDLRLKDEEIGLGQALKNDGYQTAYVGKWHLDEPEINNNLHPISKATGWDAYTPAGIRRHGFDFWHTYNAYDNHLDPHYWENSPQMLKPHKWSVEHETDMAIKYMDEIREENSPFAMVISYNPPHSPYDQVPQKYLDMYEEKKIRLRNNVSFNNLHHHTGETVDLDEKGLIETTKEYYAAISGVDDNFGRLINFLKDNNLYDDTIIILSADHGDMMGSHGLMGKHVWYEESIKIPFIVKMPNQIQKNVKTMISSEDMMPTILGLLGAPIPDTVEGIDCSKYILTSEENFEKNSFLCACPGRDIFIEKFRRYKLDPKEFGWRGIRTQEYKYIMEIGYDVKKQHNRYLYDIKNDPLEMHPLNLDKYKEVYQRLESEVIKWMENQNDGFKQQWVDYKLNC